MPMIRSKRVLGRVYVCVFALYVFFVRGCFISIAREKANAPSAHCGPETVPGAGRCTEGQSELVNQNAAHSGWERSSVPFTWSLRMGWWNKTAGENKIQSRLYLRVFFLFLWFVDWAFRNTCVSLIVHVWLCSEECKYNDDSLLYFSKPLHVWFIIPNWRFLLNKYDSKKNNKKLSIMQLIELTCKKHSITSPITEE